MGLVRSVFSKSRAGIFVPDVNGKKNNGGEKKRWGIDVRSYFRENEYLDSVGADAEEDANSSDSAHWSEASTMNNGIINKSEGAEDDNQRQLQSQYCDKKEDGTKVCWSGVAEDSAATLIQSVFRAFLARRRVHEGWNKLGEAKGGGVHENGIDNSKGKLTPTNQKTRRAKNRIAKPKEEWDNTVSSSTVSQLRNQHRLEAAMKREKALAYAFSQQLRTFNSKKKNRTQPSGDQHQTEWSWLENWIASHTSVNSLPLLKKQPTSLNKAGANNFHTKRCMVSNEEIQLVATKKFAASRCPAATQKITKVISKADAISSTKKEKNMKKKVIIIRSGSGKIKDAIDINLRPVQGIVA